MAIQQNSTLIYDNVDECPSLLKEPEELSRYSPILPLKQQIHATKYNKQQSDGNNNNHQILDNKIKNIYKYRKYTGNDLKRNYAGSSCSGRSSRSRTVSLSGVNSTEEQGHKEIPIWLGEEPRYVSGVNSRTTCNDIIKALIDDEIRNGGNESYFAKLNKYGAASRDCNDYVITESWRGIERSYDGNMAILPVWKAWSRVHNEIRLSMKHYKDVAEPIPPKQRNNWLQSIRRYLAKLFKFPKRGNKTPPSNTNKKQTHLLPIKEESSSPDEIVFIVLPDNKYDNLLDPSKFRESSHAPATNHTNECNTKAEMLKCKLYSLSETRNSMRQKKRNRRMSKKKITASFKSPPVNKSTEASNCIRRRKDAPLRNSIRHKLAQKTSEIDTLYKRENELTRRLNHKCQLYKQHNDLYANADQRLEISIGQIQRSVEQYAEEIIRTENELLELKNEIQQDISIVNNLKRITMNGEDNANDCGVPLECELDQAAVKNVEQQQRKSGGTTNMEMQFVDNIYEFCDNNASMLV
ncbi:uncharacterized protein meru [Eurosta solidaginis]|uniref:uncharacterized protein meru n=1 Tax=Eurosta solidaginis TaxID=178769 RepID=UPI00353079AD